MGLVTAAVALVVLSNAQSQPAASAPAGLVPAALEKAAHAYLTQAALEAPIRFLASDLLEGRGPATRADELTRLYLQTQLEGLGYQPAFANGAWQQPFDIVGLKAQFPKTWSFSGPGGKVDLSWREDYIAVSGLQQEQVSLSNAQLVFVGYGIQAPEFQWDDYKGVDLKGKILVMMNNDPDWDPNLFAGKRRLYYGRWDYKYESAARQGAAGAIIIHTTPSAGYPWQVVQSSWGGEQFQLPAGSADVACGPGRPGGHAALEGRRPGPRQARDAAHSRDFGPAARLHQSLTSPTRSRVNRQRRRRAAGQRSKLAPVLSGAHRPLRHRRADKRRQDLPPA